MKGVKLRLMIGAAIAGWSIAAAPAAHALFVDFTDESFFSGSGGPQAAVIGGVTVTISSTGAGGPLNFLDEVSDSNAAFCQGGGGAFACDTDGAGIGGFNFDEIDNGNDGLEVLTIDFSELVEITNVYVLDMFLDANSPDEEGTTAVYDSSVHDYTARAGFDVLPPGGNGFGSFDLDVDPYAVQSGSAGNQLTNRISFTALGGNDGAGVGDFALAGLEFNTLRRIPEPATLALFGFGLAGLGLARRRRAA